MSRATARLGPDRLARVLDLDPWSGSLDRLRGEAVALSQLAAETLGVRVGSTIDLRLGDGTKTRPTVVAIYGHGLGFGEITLPHHLLAAHTTDRSDQAILVRADAAANRTALAAALRGLAATHPGLVVLDRVGLAAAGRAQRRAQGWPSLIALAVLLAYIAIAVVNTLVMATAARGREFALLQLLGTSRTQVVRMMRMEALLVVGVATLVAVPPLVGISLGLTESPIPSALAGVYAAIIGATTALGLLAMGVPTWFALRAHPVEAIGIRERARIGARAQREPWSWGLRTATPAGGAGSDMARTNGGTFPGTCDDQDQAERLYTCRSWPGPADWISPTRGSRAPIFPRMGDYAVLARLPASHQRSTDRQEEEPWTTTTQDGGGVAGRRPLAGCWSCSAWWSSSGRR